MLLKLLELQEAKYLRNFEYITHDDLNSYIILLIIMYIYTQYIC